jgi:hypothetical protein
MVVMSGPVGLRHEDGAGLHRLAVHVDRAGPAMAGLAADMRAGQVQPLAQRVDQKLARFGQDSCASPFTVRLICIFLPWLLPPSGPRPGARDGAGQDHPGHMALEFDGAAVVLACGSMSPSIAATAAFTASLPQSVPTRAAAASADQIGVSDRLVMAMEAEATLPPAFVSSTAAAAVA